MDLVDQVEPILEAMPEIHRNDVIGLFQYLGAVIGETWDGEAPALAACSMHAFLDGVAAGMNEDEEVVH